MGELIQFPRRPVQEPWLTKRQLAQEIGFSTRWIEQQMRELNPRPMPHGRDPNGYARFKLSAVKQWMEEERQWDGSGSARSAQ